MRILHTMVRVCDLEASIRFYTEALGMRELRRKEFPGGRFTLAFLGYGEESETAVLELTWNWDRVQPYELGEAWGHLAIGCDDIHGLCDRVRSAGGAVVREPGAMKHGTTVLAFVEDPDGHKIELLERA